MKKIMLILLCFIIILPGCKSQQKSSPGPQLQYGDLTLTISPGMKAQTIEPDLNMEIASYDLYGTGPDEVTFEKMGVTGPTVELNRLPAGHWTITVEARNDENTIIADGNTQIIIIANQSVSNEIIVSPRSGNGTLRVNISWTEGKLMAPTVTGNLTPYGDTLGDTINIHFTFGGDGHSASYENTNLPAGYYLMALKLQEAGMEVAWGAMEVVRILAGQTTEGNYFPEVESHDDLCVIFEDFEDGAADNFIDDGTERWSVIGGEYVMTGAQTDDFAYSYFNADFSNFAYSVDLKQTAGLPLLPYGLYFRSEDGDPEESGYLLAIDPEGKWSLLMAMEGEAYSINAAGDWVYSPYLNNGLNTVNNLKVICVGQDITIYINDNLVESISDATYSMGKLGVWGYDLSLLPQVYTFDNFTVSPLVEGAMSGTASVPVPAETILETSRLFD